MKRNRRNRKKEAMFDFKVTQVGIPRSWKDRYSPAYDPDMDLIIGKVFFTCAPAVPLDDLDQSGALTRKSPYYGHVVVAVLKWLNENYTNFSDHDGNEFSGVKWVAEDIERVQMVEGKPEQSGPGDTKMLTETTGEVLVAKAEAHSYMKAISAEAFRVIETRTKILAFQQMLRNEKKSG